MRIISASEASRNFLRLLDEATARNETILVTRRGKPVAQIRPIVEASGASLKELLANLPRDAGWTRELRDLRAVLTRSAEDRLR